MNDFLKTLLNIRSLRAALRELSFEQLVEVKEKFDENRSYHTRTDYIWCNLFLVTFWYPCE